MAASTPTPCGSSSAPSSTPSHILLISALSYLSGAGDRAFSAGLDVEAAAQDGILAKKDGGTTDVARKAQAIKRHVEEFQACISSAEKCEKPVICVLHGYALRSLDRHIHLRRHPHLHFRREDGGSRK
ncbi:hypothetical protein EYC84_010698 [Monilinia fructicola]|uniref:Uncharacterized protein n=1 Tax=Monilinia fructicola TaxID=38448 RepID=A0A5M9J608_MONFR|nr:hypothetical protein EYC84_010698 [Monilinia fructicola]